jgi:RHS repeat-associated protein
MPLAAIDAAAVPKKTYAVHVDHLNRPIMLTDATKVNVWWASFEPFGKVRTTGGTLTQNLGLPGQWFQLESGLAHNWHRHYDPTTGRYTTADPLGFVDGPSQYAYGRNNPHRMVDPSGLEVNICCRPADIAGGMVDHCWVTTDTKSAGMGANPNITLGQEYEWIGSRVYINDHSKDKATYCIRQPNVDEQCVNDRIVVGTPIGRFIPPFNQCQYFAYITVNSCQTGPRDKSPSYTPRSR